MNISDVSLLSDQCLIAVDLLINNTKRPTYLPTGVNSIKSSLISAPDKISWDRDMKEKYTRHLIASV